MVYSKTGLILFTTVLVAILYKTVHREIGLYCLMDYGLRTFEIKVIDVSFIDSGTSPTPLRKPNTAAVRLSPIRSQSFGRSLLETHTSMVRDIKQFAHQKLPRSSTCPMSREGSSFPKIPYLHKRTYQISFHVVCSTLDCVDHESSFRDTTHTRCRCIALCDGIYLVADWGSESIVKIFSRTRLFSAVKHPKLFQLRLAI
jgi:hypothetical protein